MEILWENVKQKIKDIAEVSQIKTSFIEPSSQTISKGTVKGRHLHIDGYIAAEMIQDYHITEYPQFQEILPKDTQYIPVLKDWKELQDMVKDCNERMDFVPYVEPHTHSTYLKEHVPKEYKEEMEECIHPEEVKGKLTKIDCAKDGSHRIAAHFDLDMDKCSKETIKNLKEGKPISVSIGFMCDTQLVSGMLGDKTYTAVQRHIQIGHVAGIVHGSGKCPLGTCGIGQDEDIHPRLIGICFIPSSTAEEMNSSNDNSKPIEILPIQADNHVTVFKKTKSLLKNNMRNSSQLGRKIMPNKDGSEGDSKPADGTAPIPTPSNEDQTDYDGIIAGKDAVITMLKDQIASITVERDNAVKKIRDAEDVQAKEDRAWIISKMKGDKVIDYIGKKASELCAHDAKVVRGTMASTLDLKLTDANTGGIAGAPMPKDAEPKERETHGNDATYPKGDDF